MVGGAGLLRRDQKGCWGRKRLRNAAVGTDSIFVSQGNISRLSRAFVKMRLLHHNCILFLRMCCSKDMQHVVQSANVSCTATRTLFIQRYIHMKFMPTITCMTVPLERSLSRLRLLRIHLRNWRRAFESIALLILHCDVKVNYKKLVWDFLCSKQRHQLFMPIELFLKYNAWVVFCSDNWDNNFWG